MRLTEREQEEILAWIRETSEGDDSCLARGHQGTVHLFEGDGATYVVKAPSGSGLGLWVRRLMIRREFRAYQQLEGIEGVASCYGLLAGRYLVLQYVDADSLETHKLADREAFFVLVMDLIERIHAAGVAHCDLRRRANLLVDAGERPVLIDFGTSVRLKKRSSWLRRRVFDLMKQDDLHSWVKLKYRRRRFALPAERQLESPFLVKQIRKMLKRARSLRSST